MTTLPFGQVDQLQPADIAAYLAVSGWELEQQRGTAAEVWRLPSADRVTRLLLPRDRAFADYGTRLDDAVRLLQAMNEFSLEQLAMRVAQTRADVLYVRADQTMTDGTIPLSQAENLIIGARKMLAAAAASTLKPRAKIAGRRSQAVTDFLNDDLRMGHTQRGSFIITVLTRLDSPELSDPDENSSPQHSTPAANTKAGVGGSTKHEEAATRGQPPTVQVGDTPTQREASAPQPLVMPSFQRRVMTTLNTGLQAAARAASTPALPGLVEAVRLGASADLFDALSVMTAYEGLHTLDLTFDWAPAEPQVADTEREVVFTRDEIPQFRSASARLTEAPPIEHDSITGQVVRLERGADNDEGIVSIVGVVGRGTKRSVRLRLNGKQYAAAVTAHRRRTPVTCSGELDRTGREWWMRDPQFQVIGR